jgi:hypothetical protein
MMRHKPAALTARETSEVARANQSVRQALHALVDRFGLGTSSPWQLGQIKRCRSWAHSAQNVHSKLQM